MIRPPCRVQTQLVVPRLPREHGRKYALKLRPRYCPITGWSVTTAGGRAPGRTQTADGGPFRVNQAAVLMAWEAKLAEGAIGVPLAFN